MTAAWDSRPGEMLTTLSVGQGQGTSERARKQVCVHRRLGREIPDWLQGLPVGQMGTQTLSSISSTFVLPLSKIEEREALAGVRSLVL